MAFKDFVGDVGKLADNAERAAGNMEKLGGAASKATGAMQNLSEAARGGGDNPIGGNVDWHAEWMGINSAGPFNLPPFGRFAETTGQQGPAGRSTGGRFVVDDKPVMIFDSFGNLIIHDERAANNLAARLQGRLPAIGAGQALLQQQGPPVIGLGGQGDGGSLGAGGGGGGTGFKVPSYEQQQEVVNGIQQIPQDLRRVGDQFTTTQLILIAEVRGLRQDVARDRAASATDFRRAWGA